MGSFYCFLHSFFLVLSSPVILSLTGNPSCRGDPCGRPRAGSSPAPTCLGQIIGSFKSKCFVEYLNYIKQNDSNRYTRIWQRNYYEHVIRNGQEIYKIQEYITDNPLNWQNDIENIDRIKR